MDGRVAGPEVRHAGLSVQLSASVRVRGGGGRPGREA